MSKILVDTIDTRSGTSNITIGSSNASQITLKSGATLTNFPSNSAAFLARNSADQTLSNNTKTIITLGTEEYDVDSAYNNSTYKFTAPSAGKYFFYGYFQLYNSNNTLYRTQIYFVKNDSGAYPDDSDRYFRRAAGSSPDCFMGGYATVTADMSASDTMNFSAYGDVGAGTILLKDGAYFGGYKLA